MSKNRTLDFDSSQSFTVLLYGQTSQKNKATTDSAHPQIKLASGGKNVYSKSGNIEHSLELLLWLSEKILSPLLLNLLMH